MRYPDVPPSMAMAANPIHVHSMLDLPFASPFYSGINEEGVHVIQACSDKRVSIYHHNFVRSSHIDDDEESYLLSSMLFRIDLAPFFAPPC